MSGFFTGDKIGAVDYGFFDELIGTDDGLVINGNKNEVETNTTLTVLYVFCLTLSALSCSNIKPKEDKPSPLRLSLAKKKGKKLFSTWTLHITPGKEEKSNNGGTHASPRVHLRRGHIRTIASGKRVWVQPHVVGKKTGMIHKDYLVSA